MTSGMKIVSEEKTRIDQPSMDMPPASTGVEPQLRLLAELVSEKARSLVDKLHYRPITLQMEDPLFLALSKLADADILAAPVLGDANEYCGFLDMMQLVNYVIELCGCDTNLALGLSKNRTFRQTRVSQIMGPSPPGIPDGSSMYLALELLAITGLQRLAVLNIYNNVLSIVTQSMLIEWLADNVQLMSEQMRNTPVHVIKPYSWVIAVNEDQPVLAAFKIMQKRSVSGIAVLDYRDRIVDVVSARDLRGLGSSSLSFAGLLSSVKALKETVRKQYPAQTPAKVQVVTGTDTFEELLLCMATNKVHRVFVVRSRESAAPINTISQTDVLRFVLDSMRVHQSTEPIVPADFEAKLQTPRKVNNLTEEERSARAKAWEEKEAKTRALLPPVQPTPVQRSLYPTGGPRAWPQGWPYRAWHFRPPLQPVGTGGRVMCPQGCPVAEGKPVGQVSNVASHAFQSPKEEKTAFAQSQAINHEKASESKGKDESKKEAKLPNDSFGATASPSKQDSEPPAAPQATTSLTIISTGRVVTSLPSVPVKQQLKAKQLPLREKQARKLVWTKEGKTLADQIAASMASGKLFPECKVMNQGTSSELLQSAQDANAPGSATRPAAELKQRSETPPPLTSNQRSETPPPSNTLPEVKRNHVFNTDAPPFKPATPVKFQNQPSPSKGPPSAKKQAWFKKA